MKNIFKSLHVKLTALALFKLYSLKKLKLIIGRQLISNNQIIQIYKK